MRTKDIILHNGFRHPSTNKLVTSCVVREADGDDEDFIRERGRSGDKHVLNEFLARIIVSLGGETDKNFIRNIVGEKGVFSLTDPAAVLITSRILSEGERFTYEVKCPNPACRKKQHKSVNLGKLEISFAHPDDFEVVEVDDCPREFLFDDPDVGQIRFRDLLISDAETVTEIERNHSKEGATRELLAQIVTIRGNKPKVSDLQQPTRVRNRIRAAMESVNSALNLTIEHECSDRTCRRTWEERLPMDLSDFFFRSEGGGYNRKIVTEESKSSPESGMTFASWLDGGGNPPKSAPSD